MNASEVALAPDRPSPTDREHDVLLRTFLDFGLDAALSDPRADPIWDLRGAAAFLTDRLTVPALHEEERLGPGTPEREAAAFEHGLLRAETEALLAEIAALNRAGLRRSAAARQQLLRRVHRIELLITVHAQGVVDRAAHTDSAPAPVPAGFGSLRSRTSTRIGRSHG